MKIDLVKCPEDAEIVFNLTKDHIYQYETRKELNLEKIIMRVREDLYSRTQTINRIYIDDVHIGYISIIHNEEDVEISDFFLKDEYQDQGFGTKVLKKLVNQYNHLTLYVFKNNEKAVHLYQKFNFKVIENNTSTYRMEMIK